MDMTIHVRPSFSSLSNSAYQKLSLCPRPHLTLWLNIFRMPLDHFIIRVSSRLTITGYQTTLLSCFRRVPCSSRLSTRSTRLPTPSRLFDRHSRSEYFPSRSMARTRSRSSRRMPFSVTTQPRPGTRTTPSSSSSSAKRAFGSFAAVSFAWSSLGSGCFGREVGLSGKVPAAGSVGSSSGWRMSLKGEAWLASQPALSQVPQPLEGRINYFRSCRRLSRLPLPPPHPSPFRALQLFTRPTPISFHSPLTFTLPTLRLPPTRPPVRLNLPPSHSRSARQPTRTFSRPRRRCFRLLRLPGRPGHRRLRRRSMNVRLAARCRTRRVCDHRPRPLVDPSASRPPSNRNEGSSISCLPFLPLTLPRPPLRSMLTPTRESIVNELAPVGLLLDQSSLSLRPRPVEASPITRRHPRRPITRSWGRTARVILKVGGAKTIPTRTI